MFPNSTSQRILKAAINSSHFNRPERKITINVGTKLWNLHSSPVSSQKLPGGKGRSLQPRGRSSELTLTRSLSGFYLWNAPKATGTSPDSTERQTAQGGGRGAGGGLRISDAKVRKRTHTGVFLFPRSTAALLCFSWAQQHKCLGSSRNCFHMWAQERMYSLAAWEGSSGQPLFPARKRSLGCSQPQGVWAEGDQGEHLHHPLSLAPQFTNEDTEWPRAT